MGLSAGATEHDMAAQALALAALSYGARWSEEDGGDALWLLRERLDAYQRVLGQHRLGRAKGDYGLESTLLEAAVLMLMRAPRDPRLIAQVQLAGSALVAEALLGAGKWFSAICDMARVEMESVLARFDAANRASDPEFGGQYRDGERGR